MLTSLSKLTLRDESSFESSSSCPGRVSPDIPDPSINACIHACPIHQLPPELLIKIFIYCLPYIYVFPYPSFFDGKTHSQQYEKSRAADSILTLPSSIQLACKLWHEVSVSSSTLWSSIFVNFYGRRDDAQVQQLHRALKRSGAAPLEVTIVQDFEPSLSKFSSSVIEALAEQSMRLKKLCLTGNHHILSAFSNTTKPFTFTNLIEFQYSHSGYSINNSSNTFHWLSTAVNLHDVCLVDGTFIPSLLPSLSMCPSIRSIYTRNGDLTQVLDVLSRFKSIKSFAAEFVKESAYQTMDRLLNLPHLEELRISIPSRDPHPDNPQWTDPLPRFLDSINAPELKTLGIDHGDYDKTEARYFPHPAFEGFLYRSNLEKSLQNLELGYTRNITEVQLFRMVKAFTSLTNLTLMGLGDDSVIEDGYSITAGFLSTLVYHPSDTESGILPRLKYLQFSLLRYDALPARLSVVADIVTSRSRSFLSQLENALVEPLGELSLDIDGDFSDRIVLQSLDRLENCRQDGVNVRMTATRMAGESRTTSVPVSIHTAHELVLPLPSEPPSSEQKGPSG